MIGCKILALAVAVLIAAAPSTRVEAVEATPLIAAAMKPGAPAQKYAARTLATLSNFSNTPARLDLYGGSIGQSLPATGFFYTRRVGTRWWLIDPAGNRFLDIAVNAVAPATGPSFRRALDLHFHTLDVWRDTTLGLLARAGFNGCGAWSADDLFSRGPRRLPSTPLLNFMAGYGWQRGGVYAQPGHLGYPHGCIFVFDPGFAAYVEAQASKLTSLRDDPWIVGYFSDNELPFPRDLLGGCLGLPPADPANAAARTWLSRRRPDGNTQLSDDDREAFRAFAADKYFSICSRAIRKYDPHHLYLGSRFYGPEKKSSEFLAAAGRWLDVISVNVYGTWSPRSSVEQWARWSGRPVLVSEFYAKGQDSGMSNTGGAGWVVPTQKDRGRFYQEFTLDLLESKSCVGWQWFKYADNDPLDLRAELSNRDSNKGIVTAGCEPYQPLVEAMSSLNKQAYSLAAYFDRD